MREGVCILLLLFGRMPTDMGTFLCRVEVCPGSALDLAFPGSPVDVQVGCGEPEAISLCTKDLGGDSCVQHVVLDLGRTRLSVAPAGSGALHGSVAASIPAKYTSVSIITRGEPALSDTPPACEEVGLKHSAQVELSSDAYSTIQHPKWSIANPQTHPGKATLEGVSEAALSVQTQGGDMSLGKVKASSLTARSGGGRIFGSLVGHTVRIESEGGNVTLGNLSGEDVSVATRGGSVQAAAAYAAQLSVSSGEGCSAWFCDTGALQLLESCKTHPGCNGYGRHAIDTAGTHWGCAGSLLKLPTSFITGGGPITVDSMRCGSASLESGGGTIEVSSLDGDAVIRSGGGAIQVGSSALRVRPVTPRPSVAPCRPSHASAPTQVHAQPNAGNLRLYSEGGPVHLAWSSTLVGTVTVAACGSLLLPLGCEVEEGRGGMRVISPTGVRYFAPGATPGCSWTDSVSGPTRGCTLLVDTGGFWWCGTGARGCPRDSPAFSMV